MVSRSIEDDTDVASAILSNSYSVNSADEDIEINLKAHNQAQINLPKRWLSIRLMYLTMFLSSLGFSIILSSIWPYLQTVDKAAGENFLGILVASFSIGQLIASPVFGFLFNQWKQAKLPVAIALSISIVGNCIYSFAYAFPGQRRYALLSARFLVGFGSGCVAVVRSYVSGSTTLEERTGAMGNIALFQSLAFIVGPGLQALLSLLGYPGPIHSSFFKLDIYTSTGFLSVILLSINLILILTKFQDIYIHEESKDKKLKNQFSGSINSNSNYSYTESIQQPRTPDMVAAILCIIVFFVLLFNFSVFETIMTPLSQAMFSWNKIQATTYNGFILAGCGLISIASFLAIKPVAKFISEIDILIGSLVIVFAAFLFLVPWYGPTPPLAMVKTFNASTTGAIEATITQLEDGGCPETYSWCYTVPVIRLWQYIVGVLIHSIGYPAASVLVFSLFSKILGPIRQGNWMGLLTVGGSLARCVGPVYVTVIYTYIGPRATFLSSAGIVTFVVFLTVFLHRRLIPFEKYQLWKAERESRRCQNITSYDSI